MMPVAMQLADGRADGRRISAAVKAALVLVTIRDAGVRKRLDLAVSPW